MSNALKSVRIFISSPSDVRPERLIAERVVQRLDREFSYYFRVRPVLWEHEPLLAARHFQDFENIPPPCCRKRRVRWCGRSVRGWLWRGRPPG